MLYCSINAGQTDDLMPMNLTIPLRMHPVAANPVAPPTLSSRERLIVNAVSATMAASILLMKLAVSTQTNIELAFLMVMILCGWLLARGYATVGIGSAAIYAGLCSLLLLWQVISPILPDINFKAVGYLAIMYIPFLVRIDASYGAYELLLKRFQIVCLIIGTMVFVDWMFQFAGLKMPDLENFVPKGILFVNYNYIQPMHWGSRWIKPNAFFMLETSHTSQLLAMGLLIELCILRRTAYTLFIAAALLCTFGGTGLLMVALAAPLVLFYLTPRTLLFGLFAAPLLLVLAVQIGLTKNVETRSGELNANSQNTSGYGRFVEPYKVVGMIVGKGAEAAIFGAGAGDLPSESGHEVYVVNPSTKMIAEYGVPLGLLWLIWFHVLVFSRGAPLIVSLAALLQYNFMNGSLLVPINAYYVLFLGALFVVPKRPSNGSRPTPAPSLWGRRPFARETPDRLASI